MKLQDLVTISMKSLVRNKARAVLTMLGIVIGIGSVILMLSVGKAAENFLLANVASFGPDVVIISNGSGSESGGGPSPLQKQTLTYKDYRELKRQSWVDAVVGTIVSTAVATYGAENMNVSLWGSTPGEIEIFPATVADGRFLLDDDVDGRAKVAVIGHNVARELFGDDSAVGKLLKIRRANYRVVGVMEKAGRLFFTKLGDLV